MKYLKSMEHKSEKDRDLNKAYERMEQKEGKYI